MKSNESHTLPDFPSLSRLVLSMTDILNIHDNTNLRHVITHRERENKMVV